MRLLATHWVMFEITLMLRILLPSYLCVIIVLRWCSCHFLVYFSISGGRKTSR